MLITNCHRHAILLRYKCNSLLQYVTGFSKPSDLNIVWSGGLSGRSHFRPVWFLWKENQVLYKDIRR